LLHNIITIAAPPHSGFQHTTLKDMKGAEDEAWAEHAEAKRQMKMGDRAEMKLLTSGVKGGSVAAVEKKVSVGKTYGARAKKETDTRMDTEVTAAAGGGGGAAAAMGAAAAGAPADGLTAGVAALAVGQSTALDGGAAAPVAGGGDAMEDDDADGATLGEDEIEQVLGACMRVAAELLSLGVRPRGGGGACAGGGFNRMTV
jgi:hypothetical protein